MENQITYSTLAAAVAIASLLATSCNAVKSDKGVVKGAALATLSGSSSFLLRHDDCDTFVAKHPNSAHRVLDVRCFSLCELQPAGSMVTS